MLMDCVGVQQLDLLDIEVVFPNGYAPPNKIFEVIMNSEVYLMNQGLVFNEGETMDGVYEYIWHIGIFDESLSNPPRKIYRFFPLDIKEIPSFLHYNKIFGPDGNNKNSWFNKGNSLSDLKKYEEAVGCYSKALEIDNKYTYAWYNKGLLLIELKKYNDALLCFNKTLEIDDKYTDAWLNKGIVLIELKKNDEALLCFDKLLELDKNYSEAWYNKACIEALNDNKTKALKFLRKAIELNESWREWAVDDEDFNNIHDLKEFKELIHNE